MRWVKWGLATNKSPVATGFVYRTHDSLARQAVMEQWSRESDPHCCLFSLAKTTSNIEWSPSPQTSSPCPAPSGKSGEAPFDAAFNCFGLPAGPAQPGGKRGQGSGKL